MDNEHEAYMSDNNRVWKGIWIKKAVWLLKDLSPMEKLILVEIDSFTSKEKDCYVSNAHLAKFLQTSERRITEHISRLIKKGYLEQTRFDGRKRYLRSRLSEMVESASPNPARQPPPIRRVYY